MATRQLVRQLVRRFRAFVGPRDNHSAGPQINPLTKSGWLATGPRQADPFAKVTT